MNQAQNPFFAAYQTPYGVPPFDRIQATHFLPAFEEGMSQQNKEVDAIVSNPEPPSFENTIVALDTSGQLLRNVASVFYNLTSANTSPEIQKIAAEIAPRLSAHRDAISLNPELFERIKSIYDQSSALGLNKESLFLVENLYKRFELNGSNLSPEKQQQLMEVNSKLSQLTVKFGQHLLAETNDYKLVIDNEPDLDGLPASVIAMGAEAAKEAGLNGKWVYTTHKPSMLPFITYATNRELREKLYTAYFMRGDNNNKNDNKAIVAEIAKLRSQRAQLLGFANHAELVLTTKMAKNPEGVYRLLDQLWEASLPVAKKEARDLQAMIDAEGGNFELASWDWWYYAEKLRKEKYDLDDNELRPYFTLEHVRDAAFMVANRLYGLSFEPAGELPKLHSDAVAYTVRDSDSSYLGVLYMDFFPRASKEGGAWCDEFVAYHHEGDKVVTPIVTVVCNFTKPNGDVPSLLSIDEVETLFHEFGHALDALLSKCTYNTTFVARDFVELPSQIMEHWSTHPEVLREYARNYQSGEIIPETLIEKMENSNLFNQGFETVEFLAAALLDMKYHTIGADDSIADVDTFEKSYLDQIGLIPEIQSRYRSTYFAHIFDGGYSAGYYSYIWSGVLDNDAFDAFSDQGIYDPATAASFRKNILEKNGSEDPMEMFVKFRGREPEIDALLRNKGLK